MKNKLDQIQITTTEETAQTAGYALMGARNMLAARASAENICGEFRNNLQEEIRILSHVITAFAKADIVEQSNSKGGTAAEKNIGGTDTPHTEPLPVAASVRRYPNED